MRKAERKATKPEKEKAQSENAEAGGEYAKKEPEKAKKEPKPEKPTFPAESKVNKYGFVYVSGDMLTAFGLTKGAEHKLTVNLEGDALIIRKAQSPFFFFWRVFSVP